MFSGLESPAHLLIVLVVALLVLGPKRLPQVGRSLGSGIRHFRDSLEGKPEPEPESPEQTKEDEKPAERSPSLKP
jgi:sec-independent protein translocase protein TatA